MDWQKLLSLKSYRHYSMSIIEPIRRECEEWFTTLLMALPGEIGSKIRVAIIPFKKVGRNVRLLQGSWIYYPDQLMIGDNTAINRNCLINAGGGIEIGRNVLIAQYVIIYSQNHKYSNSRVCIADQGYSKAKVVIEDDVWLCARSIVLPGVRVREGTVVAAGAIVTKDTEPFSIIAGIPAIQIGKRT